MNDGDASEIEVRHWLLTWIRLVYGLGRAIGRICLLQPLPLPVSSHLCAHILSILRKVENSLHQFNLAEYNARHANPPQKLNGSAVPIACESEPRLSFLSCEPAQLTEPSPLL